jgi:hypothetical protein
MKKMPIPKDLWDQIVYEFHQEHIREQQQEQLMEQLMEDTYGPGDENNELIL